MKQRLAWALVFVLLSCVSCGGRETPKVLTIPGEPGHLYDVNGYHLYFECLGAGSPTVIFEAGYGTDHRSWNIVQPQVERTTRVCSYDRSGLGLSSAEHPSPRTPWGQLDDLDRLLQVAGVDPPYVLVGHSYGGVLAWLFAKRHKSDVVGLVLLDSAHPYQRERFRAALPPRLPGENAELHQLRQALSSARDEPSPENIRLSQALREAGDPGRLDDTPLIVITAGQQEESPLPKAIEDRLQQAWFALQDDYAKRSNDSVHVLARYSPHFIQSNLGQPALVVKAIREVVLAARAGRDLRACRVLFSSPAAICVD